MTTAATGPTTLVGFAGDGHVIMQSAARDLGPNDSDRPASAGWEDDIYGRDLGTGATYLLSQNADGSDSGNDVSLAAEVSANGATVVFQSDADNLGPTDTPRSSTSRRDIYAARYGGVADLATTLSATPEPVATGDQLTYAITVTNNGPDAAEDTLLHMVFPEGVTIQELSIGQGACWLKAPRVVTCEAGEVASGAVVPYAVLVHVGAPAGSTLQANVAVDSSVADRVPANDKAEVVSSVSE